MSDPYGFKALGELTRTLTTLRLIEAAGWDQMGGLLRCMTCGREESMKPGLAASYAVRGWPTCHERTMRWVTQRQLDEAAK